LFISVAGIAVIGVIAVVVAAILMFKDCKSCLTVLPFSGPLLPVGVDGFPSNPGQPNYFVRELMPLFRLMYYKLLKSKFRHQRHHS
jgi:hypothetical protein